MPSEYELHLKIRVADTPGAQPEVIETRVVEPNAKLSGPDAGVFTAWEEMIDEYERRQSELEIRVEQLTEELAQARAQAEMATALLNQEPQPEAVVAPLVPILQAPAPVVSMPQTQPAIEAKPQPQMPAVAQTWPPVQVQALAHPQAMLSTPTPQMLPQMQTPQPFAQISTPKAFPVQPIQQVMPRVSAQAMPTPQPVQRYHTPSTTYAVNTGSAFEPSFTEEGALDPLAGIKQVLGLAPKRYDLDSLSDHNDTVDGPDELMPEPWYKRIGRGSAGSF